ncbi:TPA: flagellar hook-basal body complex protein FliE [Vibrio vulnificus]|nr:flagellar hook-basal body complex protein FliE [Vibrio vulnificus]EJP4175460.1 flagellar hook-basal body complex protein FliE [Vibrio vulnificus]ELX4197052.1 flagellar hook-basal body complex protein FliE [Vibrio vulnificus]HDY8068499.1 flagellar hook-basal body complex protein FliE [Vibrio vulnificus]
MKVESISNQLVQLSELKNVAPSQNISNDFASKISKIDESIMAVVNGEDVALHEVLIEIERAKLTLEYTVVMRDKLIDAYKEITKMQI